MPWHKKKKIKWSANEAHRLHSLSFFAVFFTLSFAVDWPFFSYGVHTRYLHVIQMLHKYHADKYHESTHMAKWSIRPQMWECSNNNCSKIGFCCSWWVPVQCTWMTQQISTYLCNQGRKWEIRSAGLPVSNLVPFPPSLPPSSYLHFLKFMPLPLPVLLSQGVWGSSQGLGGALPTNDF